LASLSRINHCPEGGDCDWLYEDFIHLDADGGQRLVDHGVATEYQRRCARVGVAHGADDGEAVTRLRHVKVREKQVEALCCNALECFGHTPYGNDI